MEMHQPGGTLRLHPAPTAQQLGSLPAAVLLLLPGPHPTTFCLHSGPGEASWVGWGGQAKPGTKDTS